MRVGQIFCNGAETRSTEHLADVELHLTFSTLNTHSNFCLVAAGALHSSSSSIFLSSSEPMTSVARGPRRIVDLHHFELAPPVSVCVCVCFSVMSIASATLCWILTPPVSPLQHVSKPLRHAEVCTFYMTTTSIVRTYWSERNPRWYRISRLPFV